MIDNLTNILITKVYAQSPVNLDTQYSFGKINSLGEALNYIVPYVFAFAGTAVVIYFLIGAIRFIFSAGDKNTVAAAQAMITHAIIGIVLLIVMFLLIYFIPELLGLPRFQIIK